MNEINKKLIRFFSSLGNETRLRILFSIYKKPKTVNEIHQYFGRDGLTLSAISHQLKQLNDFDIVVYKKIGREKVFSLSSTFCWCILQDAIKHFKKN